MRKLSVITMFVIFASAALFAGGQKEKEAPQWGAGNLPAKPIELSGTIQMIGSARESSPALLLDEDSIALLGGDFTALGIIGPGADALEQQFQGNDVTISGIVMDREGYSQKYQLKYPVKYLLFAGFVYVEADREQ